MKLEVKSWSPEQFARNRTLFCRQQFWNSFLIGETFKACWHFAQTCDQVRKSFWKMTHSCGPSPCGEASGGHVLSSLSGNTHQSEPIAQHAPGRLEMLLGHSQPLVRLDDGSGLGAHPPQLGRVAEDVPHRRVVRTAPCRHDRNGGGGHARHAGHACVA